MMSGHFDRLDPTLKKAIRSAVHTAQWAHKAHDQWHDGKRIHVYPVVRFQNRMVWAVITGSWEIIATGIMPDDTEGL